MPKNGGPRLLRFFYLLTAHQAMSESLAIDTLSEFVRTNWPHAGTVGLVGHAIRKVASLPQNGHVGPDSLARAVSSLPRRHGSVIALIRGMEVGMADVAEAMRVSEPEAKRLFAEAVLALHRVSFGSDSKAENRLER